jgi:signal transduction histidine kinase
MEEGTKLAAFLYQESGPWPFLILTIGLGGWSARIAGRSLANSWQNMGFLPFLILPLAASIRFLHYALYGAILFSSSYFLVDYGFILIFAAWGYFTRRSELMNGLYPWAFRRYALLGWRKV